MNRRLGRALLWGVLIAALVAVALATVLSRLQGRGAAGPPPPVLGTVPDFALTDQSGAPLSRADLAGTTWIVDFIFTRCTASCPVMSGRMAGLDRDLPRTLRLVSISIDPAYDTPSVLTAYARQYRASSRWTFLTGGAGAIYGLVRGGFKLGIEPAPTTAAGSEAEPTAHSTRFVLVDGAARIRGYYDAFDRSAMKRLRRDARTVAAGR